MISGFVISWSLQRARWTDFAISRVARLLPAYYASMALTIFLIIIFHNNYRHLSISDLPSNLLMAAPLVGAIPIDEPYWTLTRELFFYLLAGSLYFLGGPRRFVALAALWMLIASVSNLMIADTHFYVARDLWCRLAMVLNLQFANLFCAGMMISQIRMGEQPKAAWATLVLALLSAGFSEWPLHHSFALKTVAMSTAYAGIVAWTVMRPPTALRIGALRWLGQISYSLYLGSGPIKLLA